MISSLVPDASQYAPSDERRRDELMRKSKGIGEAEKGGKNFGSVSVHPLFRGLDGTGRNGRRLRMGSESEEVITTLPEKSSKAQYEEYLSYVLFDHRFPPRQRVPPPSTT